MNKPEPRTNEEEVLSYSPDVGVILLVAKFREEQPNPETAFMTCYRCGRGGYVYPCRSVKVRQNTPDGWEERFICRDCSHRDDPYIFEYAEKAVEAVFPT